MGTKEVPFGAAYSSVTQNPARLLHGKRKGNAETISSSSGTSKNASISSKERKEKGLGEVDMYKTWR